MDKFTLEQMLSVANEIEPIENNSPWEIHYGHISRVDAPWGVLCAPIRIDYVPEKSNSQWRKLSEWCNDKRVFISLFKDRYYAMQVEVSIHHDGDVGYVLVHDSFETQTECMIAAVLAYLENKND
jgi:hypothetical protein